MSAPDIELLRLLPKVLRARDFHLYLEGGKRLTDLWLQGGRAILGHKPPRVLSELKNAAERGLFCSLPHPMERRFIKALGEFFPGRFFRLYMHEASLFRALEEAGYDGSFQDPAFPLTAQQQPVQQQPGKKLVSLWRPFIDEMAANGSLRPDTVFIPVLPWPLGPAVLVLDKNADASFPPGDIIPPVLLAPAARALYDLAAAMKAKAPNRLSRRYPKIERVLGVSKPDGEKRQSCLWQRQGIYLTVEPGMDRYKYEDLFRRFLEGGFLIPPTPEEPVIMPGEMSQGEEAKLALAFSS